MRFATTAGESGATSEIIAGRARAQGLDSLTAAARDIRFHGEAFPGTKWFIWELTMASPDPAIWVPIARWGPVTPEHVADLATEDAILI